MRAQLLHLSGPYRGRTITHTGDRLLIGTESGADIRFPEGMGVAERHAELIFQREGCSFYLKAADGDVFVNRAQITEVILLHGDLIEIGVGGPKVRFRVQDDGRPCKPMRQMLSDAREVRAESGLVAGTRTLRRDLIRHSTPRLRASMFVLMLMVALGSAYVGGLLGSTQTASRQEELRRRITDGYEKELAAIREQVEQFRRQQAGHVSREEVEKLRADLTRRAVVVDRLVERNVALKKVLEVYSRGVCLIHGIYAFEADVDGQIVPVTQPDGSPLELEYIGSGFLIDTDGLVVTNRHVAEPWWNNAAVEPLLAQNLVPHFVTLSASFPGKEPTAIDPSTIRLSPDGVDVALLRVTISDVPALPLFRGDVAVARGGRVVLLGYPTGLNALLARAEPELVSEAMAAATSTATLIAELARRGVISPVITQGSLNEVKERRLVYDAETTSGGSGGPVFGPDGSVIGVNFAITADFDGSNFGVPIQYVRNMLP